MITFKNVTKIFGNGNPALEEVSFHVNKGDFVLLFGHSGAGKTTIARLLMKEYDPTSGEIEFDGQPLSNLKRSKLHLHRRDLGIVFQDYKLVPDLTIAENIALALQIASKPASEIKSRVNDLLQLVQLPDKAELFPSQLSGGEIQRVSIARALANAPKMLFADEPTGNLDKETGRHIVQILKKINELGTTIIMSTHEEFDFSGHPHQIFKLEKGRLIYPESSMTPEPTADETGEEVAGETEMPPEENPEKNQNNGKIPHQSGSSDSARTVRDDSADVETVSAESNSNKKTKTKKTTKKK